MTLRRLLTLTLASTTLLGACHPKDKDDGTGTGTGAQASADEYRNATPRADTVKVVVPGDNGGKALSVETQSQALTAAAGQTADFYVVTRVASGIFNGGAILVLGLVKAIVSLPPTSLSDGMAVWGPGSDPLDPIVWRLTVTRKSASPPVYDYKLEGRAKLDASAPFIAVLSGTHAPALDASGHGIEGFGGGNFTLDNDARNMLPLPERKPNGDLKNVGQAHYTYERATATAMVSIDAQFVNVRDDDTNQIVNLGYSYRATPGMGGSMDFLHVAPPATVLQTGTMWKIHSRWMETGAGRSDVTGAGGTIPSGLEAHLSECWDVSFASRYQRANWDPNFGWGVEATDCVFTSAEYSTLQ